MGNRKISELDQILNLDEQAEFPLSQDNGGTPTTFKAKLTQIATKIAEAITFSNLITNNKHIIGAINEVAQGGGGTTDYDDLENKPQINSVELSGNKSLDDLGIQPSEISKSASGTVATFSDGGDNIPVKAFECEISAQQESGTPTPVNPLAITGFSQADIGDISDATNITYFKGVLEGKYGFVDLSSLAWSYQSAGERFVSSGIASTVKAPASNDDVANVKCSILQTTYANNTSAGGLDNSIGITSTSKNIVIKATGAGTTQAGLVAFLSGCGFIYELETPTTPTITPEQFKSLCLAFGITSDMFIVSFGQTIYGGRLIYANGAWAIEAGKAMNLISDLDWSYNSESTRFSTSDLRGIVKNAESTSIPLEGLSCECYVNDVAGSSRQIDLSVAVNTTGITLLKDTNYTDVTSLLSAVGNYKIVYPLATPVIIPITSSTRVKTISGANNIFSNTGDVELEYFTEKADEIAELVEEEIASMSADYHAYSTDEQIVGRWIDGNTIYEKVVDLGALPNNATKNIAHGISNLGKVIQAELSASDNNSIWLTIPYATTSTTDTKYQIGFWITDTNVVVKSDWDRSALSGYAILRYTKSSSNTRSLNLSKGIEENPIEEKTEEIKEAENEDTER